jgi:hypothetical protein
VRSVRLKPDLFAPKRAHRIHPGRAPSRNERGQPGGEHEQARRDDEAEGIERADLEEQRRDIA